MESPRVRLGELLVRAGLISAEQLEEALAEQRRVGKRLGSLLVEGGLVSETQVTQILSQQLSVPWVSLHHIDFSRELLNLVPVDIVERYCLVPIYVRRVRGLGDALYVAMDDPTNAQALVDVAERAGLHVRAMIAPPSDIRAAIRAYYGVGEEPPRPAPPPKPAAAPKEPAPPPEQGMPGPVQTPAEAAAPPAEAPPKSSPASSRGFSVERAGERARAAPPKPGGRRMIALTLLDGTTIRVPSKEKSEPGAVEGAGAAEAAAPAHADEQQLSAKDIVAALRAASHGADASDILGENVRWEAMFAALLSVLLKKHLITDFEFIDEFKKS